jgi:DNA-binding transcriptional LysR family regulator
MEPFSPWLVFARVAREGSFTAAANALGLSKSMVSQQVKKLEIRYGMRLFERNTRSVRLTEAGVRLLGACTEVEHALGRLDAVLEDVREAVAGRLKVATTYDLALRLVIPAAAEVVLCYPSVTVDVVADDVPTDIISHGFDLAVNLGMTEDSSLVRTRLAVFDEPIVATPALAARLGPATRPRDLERAPCVGHSFLVQGDRWTFHHGEDSEEVTLDMRGQANTGEGVRALILSGLGLGCLPSYFVEKDLELGRLVLLCQGWIWK